MAALVTDRQSECGRAGLEVLPPIQVRPARSGLRVRRLDHESQYDGVLIGDDILLLGVEVRQSADESPQQEDLDA